MFSSRLPAELSRNVLSQTLDDLRRSGTNILDLTESNPTAVGLSYPAGMLSALGDPASAAYRPDPRGSEPARHAVAASYRDRAVVVDAGHIVLTASTSEAYGFLFKLLCDPGDNVLVPQPSYPLFDILAGLEGVAIAPYRLHPLDEWRVDRDGIVRALTTRSRAILLVSPNNPTGSILRSADREWLVAVARSHGLAIIADEVFADYPLSPPADATSFIGEDRVLTFALGGLSKSAGLPQMKLAWIAASGPPAMLAPALERLDMIADTYLSVSTPVQVAAARLLTEGASVRQAIAGRLRQNLASLRSSVGAHPELTLFEPEGGWSAVLRVPATVPEEQIVLQLLTNEHVLVHPGYFFDFSEEAYLVLSLLPDPAVFLKGVSRLMATIAEYRP